MVTIEDLEKRIGKLEGVVAHQESTIEDLSDGISTQWEIIDTLKRSADFFSDKIMNFEEHLKTHYIDKPPPHY